MFLPTMKTLHNSTVFMLLKSVVSALDPIIQILLTALFVVTAIVLKIVTYSKTPVFFANTTFVSVNYGVGMKTFVQI